MAKKYVKVGKSVKKVDEPGEKEKQLEAVEHPKKKNVKPDKEKPLNETPE